MACRASLEDMQVSGRGAEKAGREESMPAAGEDEEEEEVKGSPAMVPPPPPPGPPPLPTDVEAASDAYADAMLVSEEPLPMSLSGPGVHPVPQTFGQ